MNIFDVFLGRGKQKSSKDATSNNSFMDFTTKYADDSSSEEEEEEGDVGGEEHQRQPPNDGDTDGTGPGHVAGPVGQLGRRRTGRERWPYTESKYEGQGVELAEPRVARPGSASMLMPDEYVAWVCNGRDDDFERLRGVLGIDLD